MKFHQSAAWVVLALGILMIGDASAFADDSDARVSLMLSAVSAEKRADDTLFRCDVAIVNDTENVLTVSSNFYSAFDGLELVVTDADGKTIKQQPYTSHQSPFTHKGRQFPLKRGKTQTSLAFPISSFNNAGQILKVRLVGTLPGSTYTRILSTETLQLAVSKRPNRTKQQSREPEHLETQHFKSGASVSDRLRRMFVD